MVSNRRRRRRRQPDPAWPEERAADEVRVTSASADGRARGKDANREDTPGPETGGPGRDPRPGGGRGRGGRSASASSRQPQPGRCLPRGRARLCQRQHEGTNTIGAFERHADGTLTPEAGRRSRPAGPGPAPGCPRRARSRSRRTAGSCSRSTRAATRSPCCGSTSAAPSAPCRRRDPLPAAPCPTASPADATWSTSPTPGTASANYTGFRLGLGGRLFPIPGLPSPWPLTRRPVTCCSTARAPNWPVPSGHLQDRQFHRRLRRPG